MPKKLTKEQIERRVFEVLAPLAGIDVLPGSIRQLPPPAPDILCASQAGEQLGFELVALDDEYTRKRLALWNSTDLAWDRALASWPEADQTQIKTRCTGLHLSVTFNEAAALRARTQIMREIQKRLLNNDAQFAGELFPKHEMPAELTWARVFRGVVAGAGAPHITTSSAGSWCAPQIDKIKEKLVDKRYEIEAPLELIAYAVHDEPDGHVDSLTLIKRCIDTYLPGSRFDRVSVINLAFKQLVYRSAE